MNSRLRQEEGASAVIVAISIFLLFGAGAIAIDLGSAWDTKRNLVLDTDAAAVAAARHAAEVGGCVGDDQAHKQVAVDFLEANLLKENPDATFSAGDVDYTCTMETNLLTPNTVQVDFTGQATQTLSDVLGTDQLDVFSSSTAEFNGYAASGLRPLVVCVDLIDESSPPGRYIVPMEKTWQSDACGGNSGNWGYLCFDVDAGCSNTTFENFLWHGYPDPPGDPTVDLNTALGPGTPHPFDHPGSDEVCGTAPSPYWCIVRTGAALTGGAGGSEAALSRLVDTQEIFSVLISDCIGENTSGTCDPMGGSQGTVHPYAFAQLTLDGWCVKKNTVVRSEWVQADGAGLTNADCHGAVGADGTPAANNELVLALNVLQIDVDGTPDEFFNPDDYRVELCGVDHDPGLDPNRCDRVFGG